MGPGSAARFNNPGGLALDDGGNLYVTDSLNNTIRKITPTVSAGQTNWVVTTLAGSPGIAGCADGTGSAAQFYSPSGIAVDKAGNVYVADFANSTIRKMRPSVLGGQTQWLVTTIGGLAGHYGAADGTGSAARFDSPSGIVVNSAGCLFVADWDNDTVVMGLSPPYIVLDAPAIGNGHAQINFSLLSGMGTSFSLLSASRPDGPWSTNAAAVLTTNAPGASYAFIAPLPQVAAQFYRVQLPVIWQLPLLIPNLTASAPSSGGLFLVRSSLSHEIISHRGLDPGLARYADAFALLINFPQKGLRNVNIHALNIAPWTLGMLQVQKLRDILAPLKAAFKFSSRNRLPAVTARYCVLPGRIQSAHLGACGFSAGKQALFLYHFYTPHAHFFPSASSPAFLRSSGVMAILNSTSAWKVKNHGSARAGMREASGISTTRTAPRLPQCSVK